MGARPIQKVPCAKGPVCYALDKLSRGRDARARLRKLRDAIRKLAPDYAGLSETFDRYLLSHVFRGAAGRARMVDHLNACWFNPDSRTTYFPGAPVARIYAEGVLKALELSLKGRRRVVPLDAWWVADAAGVSLLTFADVKGSVTISDTVFLLIETPRPKSKAEGSTSKWILGDTAEAYVTRWESGRVVTLRVRTLK